MFNECYVFYDMFSLVYRDNTLLPEGQNVSRLSNSSLATAPAQIYLMADVRTQSHSNTTSVSQECNT